MLIEEITIKNLLSFGPKGVTLPMRPLNVLIGPNGSGKSNFIDVIRLINAAPKDLWEPVKSGGDHLGWFYQGSATGRVVDSYKPASLSVDISLSTDSWFRVKYELQITPPPIEYRGFEVFEGWIEKESLTRRNWGGDSSALEIFSRDGDNVQVVSHSGDRVQANSLPSFDETATLLSQVRGPLGHLSASLTAAAISDSSIYGFWQTGRYTTLRGLQRRIGNSDRLLADYSNLTVIVSEILSDSERGEKFIDFAKMLYEGLSDIRIEQVGEEYCQLVLYENRRRIPVARMSDGTLRLLCLLATLMSRSTPRIVCIEEPELGLHPDLIVQIADLLKEASTRMQLVVTTHSDILLDALSDTPESVVVCSKEEGETVMTRLNADELRPYLEEQTLSSLWNSGQLGGRRW